MMWSILSGSETFLARRTSFCITILWLPRIIGVQLLGGSDHAPKTALDELSNAQFYTFLNRMVQNKAIDRLCHRRLPMSTTSELEAQGNPDDANKPF